MNTTMNMNRVWPVVLALVIFKATSMTVPEWPSDVQQANRGKAYGADETAMVEARRRQRQAAFAVLDRPWASRCAGEERKQFIGGLNAYYSHRQSQVYRYQENFGKLGTEYIAKQWSTADDRRIDHMTQEAYAGGYLRPSDFDDVAGKAVATVVMTERASGRACPS